jgi:tetratricopeptide (TPR) repeat protein
MSKACAVFFALVAALGAMRLSRAEDISAQLQRAEEMARAGKRQESTLLYREVLKSAPKCWQAYAGIGRNDYAEAAYADAASAFAQAMESRPDDPELLSWLGRSYLQTMHPEKIPDLVGRAKPAVANSCRANLLLARADDAQDRVEEAQRELAAALQVDPRCHGAKFAQGFIDLSTGNLTMAQDGFRQELQLDPTEVLPAYYLAEVLDKQGKLEEAAATLEQMGRAAPHGYLYHLGMGKLYERQHDRSRAAGEFREAVRQDPSQPEAHYRLAFTLRALGETAQANDEFQAFSQLQSRMMTGMGQGMGRMRPRLPDFE